MNRTFWYVMVGMVFAGSAVAVAIPPAGKVTSDAGKPRIESTSRFISDRRVEHSGWERIHGRFDRDGNCFLMADGGLVRGLSPFDPSGRFVATNAWKGKQGYGAPHASGAYVLDGDTLSVYLSRPGIDVPVRVARDSGPLFMVFEDQ